MRILTIFALLSVLLDQVSKYVVIHVMGVSAFKSLDVLPPTLRFVYGENRGINFGLFGDGTSRWVFVVLALTVCAAVLFWMWKKPQRPLALLSAGLLIGGALGNVIDRVLYGYVLDFLNTSCCGINNPFVYNVADVFIFVGAIGLVVFADEQSNKKGA